MIRKITFCVLPFGLGAWYIWFHARLYYLYHNSNMIFLYRFPDFKLFLACLAGGLFCITTLSVCIQKPQARQLSKGTSMTLVGIALVIALTAKHGLIEEIWLLLIYLLAAFWIFKLPNIVLTKKG